MLHSKNILSLREINIFDAHCHLQMEKEEEIECIMSSKYLRGFGLCGTRPEDWMKVIQMKDENPTRIFCGIGVHPYFAHLYQVGSVVSELRSLLLSDNQLIVGEIGVDKHWVTKETGANEFELQRLIFEAQFDLSVEMNRAVVIHCVRAHGYLFNFLRSKAAAAARGGVSLPPSVYLHAWGGSAEITQQLLTTAALKDKLYFGFAASVNLRNEKRLRDLIGLIPLRHLMLESDAENAGCVNDDLAVMAALLAEVKGVTTEDIYERTKDNVGSFLLK
jgi:Tat protein secretion system quality control protein TatD with DNase activity